jgi:hypothetical protein
MKFPTKQLILEGPDLSGKTTLCDQIHKASGYRWNIQDRSSISMVVFSKLYNRESFYLIENLKSDMLNLNNRFVILMPEWGLISTRFISRGDELHDLVSLKKSYDLFCEASREFENYPNVIVSKDPDCLEMIIGDILSIEDYNLKRIQQQVLQLVACTTGEEALGVNFTIYDNGSFLEIDEAALDYESEKAYYDRIRSTILNKIAEERAGNNEYSRKEKITSRRFIYTDDSCISLAHFNYREECLDCHFVLRSSNVRDTLYYDLNFLYSLCKDVACCLELESKTYFRLRFTINSAHIPVIINDEE